VLSELALAEAQEPHPRERDDDDSKTCFRLEEAVAANRFALQEFTRERAPLNWAAAQLSLGSALAALGWRESGAAYLQEAVAAYREALKVQTRDRVPLRWAATQNLLGMCSPSSASEGAGRQSWKRPSAPTANH
jgi:hypothetical protein